MMMASTKSVARDIEVRKVSQDGVKKDEAGSVKCCLAERLSLSPRTYSPADVNECPTACNDATFESREDR